ncbi:MAG: NDP-sugar synthase [Acidobacteriota bacterium]|nr:NDP-sugar synthase [Blastocatellia bacterium]MDW8412537.1 NDP-sugar synthase [Acidobacteriota bacterium]
MILAAGFGTRLWPLTIDRTKPAVPFLNKPLIVYSVEYLRSFGVDEIIVNLHHQAESIVAILGDGSSFSVRISYSYESVIMGTSGALDLVRELLQDGTFIVMNGKLVTNIDLAAAMQLHRSRNALATLVLKQNVAREKFSKVFVDTEGNILGFGAYPEASEEPVPLMFTGIQIMEPEILKYVPRGVFSHSTIDVYPKAIACGERIASYVAEGEWHELSTLRRYLDASLQLLSKSGKDIVLGEGCSIEPTAHVRNSVLWKNVTVGKAARLNRVVIGDEVTVPPGTVLSDAVIVKYRDYKIERGQVVDGNLIVAL